MPSLRSPGWLSCVVVMAAACSSSPSVVDESAVTTVESTSAPTSLSTTVATTNPATTQPSPSTTAKADLAGTVTQVVDDFVGDADGGAVALMRKDGEITRHAAGAAHADGSPLAVDDQLRVGSISKPFVASMLLQMVEEGVVDLEQPLSTYLSDVPVGGDVAIRDLLSHQSGVPSYTDQPTMFTDAFGNRERVYSPTDMLDYVVDVEPDDPGSFYYSNTNYILLGLLVEAIDGTDLSESLATRITGPLGLTDTLFDVPGVSAADPVAGWSPGVLDGTHDLSYDSISSGAWAAGALVSTVDDLAAFADALFGGDVISDDQLAAMTDVGASGYGFGIAAVRLSASLPGFGHNGGIPGFTSTFGVEPETGNMIVVITNNDRLAADQLAFEMLTATG